NPAADGGQRDFEGVAVDAEGAGEGLEVGVGVLNADVGPVEAEGEQVGFAAEADVGDEEVAVGVHLGGGGGDVEVGDGGGPAPIVVGHFGGGPEAAVGVDVDAGQVAFASVEVAGQAGPNEDGRLHGAGGVGCFAA